jgi:hypothetical protein
VAVTLSWLRRSAATDRPATPTGPYRLAANEDRCWLGAKPGGAGFVLTGAEARRLLGDDPAAAAVVRPYLGGRDLNTAPDQRPGRWVVDFGDRTEAEARAFPGVFAHLEARADRRRRDWWRFEHPAAAMRRGTAGLDRVIALARVSDTVAPALVAADQVVNEKVVVFAGGPAEWGVLAAAPHVSWARARAARRRTDLSYDPAAVFATYPWPDHLDGIAGAAAALHGHRAAFMGGRRTGLTATYRRLRDATDRDPAVERLRELHRRLDRAVLAAYGWEDVDPAAGDELVRRLLDLNRRRHVTESAGRGAG